MAIWLMKSLSVNGGKSLDRNASDYPYKQDLLCSRAAYSLLGCLLLLLFNGWGLFLSSFGDSGVFASMCLRLCF
jgi:hypothetical protein